MQDFTIDGLVVDDKEDANDNNFKDAYRDIPLYVTGERAGSSVHGSRGYDRIRYPCKLQCHSYVLYTIPVVYYGCNSKFSSRAPTASNHKQ